MVGLGVLAIGLYGFLYIPLLVLIIRACTYTSVSALWSCLVAQPAVMHAAGTSLLVAGMAATLSVAVSVAYVCWAAKARISWLLPIFYISTTIPEVVFSVSLLQIFTTLHIPLGLPALVVGHTLLGLGFAVPVIRAQYLEIDPQLIEASRDLGASEQQTFFKIIVPLLRPAILSSLLFVFVLSCDDFLIAFFCSGTSAQTPGSTTLSLYVFDLLHKGESPLLAAISIAMVLVSIFFVSLSTFLGRGK